MRTAQAIQHVALFILVQVVERFRDRWIHPFVAHLLEGTLLRPGGILKRVLLGPKLFLMNQLLTVFDEARQQLKIGVPVVLRVHHWAVVVHDVLVRVVQRLTQRSRSDFFALLLIHYDRRLHAIAGVALLKARVLLVRVSLQALFGLLLSQFLLATLQSIHLNHVGALPLVLPVWHLLGLDILKMNDCF